ncbi:putative death-receptor fusion protein-domain-containing protein [Neohortaea acidophila]|uniref:Putative death-receptor fusion protein-domain-containing protein n=1 Tax=Neohortaea acidophila TaxID=245834 RepID=A0A6A6PPV0_9PEZI|nr:putative death-receptor fusion protein-domain-containing protein [Neohortaea acidophila]KAF2481654.1 putative death-receptor fusion protein-domain-containing protein [Neohortaea acidophila]
MAAHVSHGDPVGLLTEEQVRWISRHVRELVQFSDVEQPSDSDTKKLKHHLDAVLHTADASDINGAHRVAAWNALSALIDGCSRSQYHACSAIIWQAGIWKATLDLYINRSAIARPKSSKQLLASLCNALSTNSDDLASRQWATGRLVRSIASDENPARVKACLQVLAHFLAKDVFPLDEVLLCWSKMRYGSRTIGAVSVMHDLILVLLAWVGKADFGSVVGHVISVLLDKIDANRHATQQSKMLTRITQNNQPLWVKPLDEVFMSGVVGIDELRIHILPILFRRGLSGYTALLASHGLQQLECEFGIREDPESSRAPEDDLLYAALQVGKELGMLHETEDSCVSRTSSEILLPVRWIRRLLTHSSRGPRLAGLTLLITSHSATRPFSPSLLSLMKKYLHTFFSDTDANFRGEVMTLMQRLMDRLRAITVALAKKCGAVTQEDPLRATYRMHQSFLQWLVTFLTWELRPTATYQRHISALKTLLIVTRSGCDSQIPSACLSKSALAETRWPFTVRVVTEHSRALLLDLLLDPFDDVRQTAASILSCYSGSYDASTRHAVCQDLERTVIRAENLMLQTGRADQADGVAHLYALLYQHLDNACSGSSSEGTPQLALLEKLLGNLERMLDVAQGSLPTAVNKYPVHGLLTSLRYILIQGTPSPSLTEVCTRLVSRLQTIWRIVKRILCNDAPEGHVPQDFEDGAQVSTKDTLSYCWRALKESSLLLGVLVSKDLLNVADILSLGDLSFSQLAELRHRGAFSTVAQTWTICCTRCSTLRVAEGTDQLEHWYDQVFHILSSRTTINTRRSAGIPALLCGLLVADKTGRLLARAFENLTAIAIQPVDRENIDGGSLPQVHALNCIKDILKSTSLSELSDRHVPGALEPVARSLRSDVWAIRNCGLMLFRAVIDRLLGTSAAHLEEGAASHQRLSAEQHPKLVDITLDLLAHPKEDRDSGPAEDHEALFPALQLLQQMDLSHQTRAATRKKILLLVDSPSWLMRDKAARTYASLVTPDEVGQEITARLGVVPRDSNGRHGALLCMCYLIRRLQSSQSTSIFATQPCASHSESDNFSNSNAWLPHLLSASPEFLDGGCAATQAAYVQAIAETTQLQGPDFAFDIDIARKLEYSLMAENWRPEHHVLRSALALALGHQICIDQQKSGDGNSHHAGLQTLILSLAAMDADACSVFFGAFTRPRRQLSTLPKAAVKQLWYCATEVLKGPYDRTLRSKVQALLLRLCDECDQHGIDEPQISALAEALNTAAASPFLATSHQDYADQWLQLQAVVLEHQSLGIDDGIPAKHSQIHDWVQFCCEAIQGDGFFSRQAAALAISRVRHLWRHLAAQQQSGLCELCFGVYDLLNDDDEDIRLLASRAVGCITRTNMRMKPQVVKEPSCASERLVQWMLGIWSTNHSFIRGAFARALGIKDSAWPSVAEQISTYETSDYALFAEEKQNLYIDEAREVKLWSRVLLKVDLTTIPPSLLRAASQWTCEGLDVMIAKCTAETDGALGWSTKGEVFTLGLQLIYGVEVLLHTIESGVRLPVRPSALRMKLGLFGEAAGTSGINTLWVRETDRVLTWAVEKTLQRHYVVVNNVERSGR